MSTGVAVEAIGLSKSFKVRTERRTSLKERLVRGKAPAPEQFWALRDATFAVPKGGSLGLIGQNGSGKSTALKVLAGIYRPTAGQVRVNGSVSALLEVGAGFHPELTGRENIRLNATILGFTNREIDQLMDQIIEFADIGDHIDGPIKHYSSGMYVRLGFAVAVMVRPDILIVDEVIAVGDEEFQRKCYEYLYDLRRAGTSMIIVSHGLGQIADLCDEAVWLDHGQVRGVGASRSIVRRYLDDVNLREIARATSATTAEIQTTEESSEVEIPEETDETAPEVALPNVREQAGPLEQKRRGTGAIRVTHLEVLDSSGNPSGIWIAGQPAVLRIHYSAHQDTPDVIFGFGLFNHDDMAVCGVNSAVTGSWFIRGGEGSVEFRADPWLLAAGRYLIRVMIKSGAAVVDAVDDGPWVHVREASVEMAGIYLQPGSWTLMSASEAGEQAD